MGSAIGAILSAIGAILPHAVGVAVSPVPIIAVILLLFSRRARTVAPAFLLGWMAGLAIVAAIILAIAGGVEHTSKRAESTVGASVQFVLGLLLLFLAYRQWRGRPKPGEEAKMPTWLGKLDTITPLAGFGLGAALAALNPKNLPLTIGAALAIASAGLSPANSIIVLVVYVVLASITVGGPVLYFLVARSRATPTLSAWKAWLSANNATVMGLLFLVFGAVLLGKGIGGLTS
ncbi:MAG: GAP family protein [Ktedonobacterales bacterium]